MTLLLPILQPPFPQVLYSQQKNGQWKKKKERKQKPFRFQVANLTLAGVVVVVEVVAAGAPPLLPFMLWLTRDSSEKGLLTMSGLRGDMATAKRSLSSSPPLPLPLLPLTRFVEVNAADGRAVDDAAADAGGGGRG
jgi:hypothetical protein